MVIPVVESDGSWALRYGRAPARAPRVVRRRSNGCSSAGSTALLPLWRRTYASLSRSHVSPAESSTSQAAVAATSVSAAAEAQQGRINGAGASNVRGGTVVQLSQPGGQARSAVQALVDLDIVAESQ